MSIAGVYAIINRVTGNRYIGASVDVHDRWLHHRNALRRGVHRSKVLQREWDRFGESSFRLRILLSCKPDRVLLDKHELKAIRASDPSRLLNANPTNITLRGHKRSEAFKRKIGASSRGRKHSDATRAKMSAAHAGRQYTLGYKHDDEFRRKRSEYMLVNNPNDDPAVRQKKSIKMKAWWAAFHAKKRRR